MNAPVVYAVMAGGRGERLWPLVRRRRPKVCVELERGRSLLTQTIDRIQPLVRRGRDHVMVVTTAAQARPIRAALRRGRSRATVLVEPQPRNTAACLLLAAAVAARRTPSAVVVALPADHWVGSAPAFRRCVRRAIHAARRHAAIVTIGMRPTRVHPGLGHLCAGRALGPGVRRVTRFIEKPSPAQAKRLLRSRAVYWNAGIFVAQADVLIAAANRRLPAHAAALCPLALVSGTPAFARAAARVYRGLAPVSFDAGVMARERGHLMVEGTFAWDDLGSWESFARTSGMAVPTISAGDRNVEVISFPGHLVATIGMRDLLIVETDDATLICRRDRTQDVRAVVARLARDPRLARYL